MHIQRQGPGRKKRMKRKNRLHLKQKLAVDARVDASASPEAIDVTGAYTRADADTEAFKNELYGNLEAKFPNLCALIQSLAAGADEAED